MPGELGISPDVSEEMEAEGEVGGCGISSWTDESGVWRSQEAIPVRRRFEGGMFMLALFVVVVLGVDGDWPWGSYLMSSWEEVSSSMFIDERGEPGESAIWLKWILEIE